MRTTYRYKNRYGETADIYFVRNRYDYYGGLAVEMFWNGDGYWEDFATITVNLTRVGDRQAFLDENNLPGIGKWLEANGLARDTGTARKSGYCQYPLYEFTEKFYEESETPDWY